MPSVHLVYMDDWQALYVDGKLVLENHSLRAKDILKAIGVEFQALHLEENLEIRECLPANFEELQQLLEKGQ